MSSSEIVGVVLVVLVLLAVAGAVLLAARKKKRTATLKDRYGPEYDHAVGSAGHRSAADAELQERMERREQLDIRPLAPAARERYLADWASVQSLFVDDPVGAVREADSLLDRVLLERGYPADDFASKSDMLAVDHPEVVQHYRGAHEVSDRGNVGQATTEELRGAFVHYRSLFERLLEDPSTTTRSGGLAPPSMEGAPVHPVSPPRSEPRSAAPDAGVDGAGPGPARSEVYPTEQVSPVVAPDDVQVRRQI